MLNGGTLNGAPLNGVSGGAVVRLLAGTTIAYSALVASDVTIDYAVQIGSHLTVEYSETTVVAPKGLHVDYRLMQYNPIDGVSAVTIKYSGLHSSATAIKYGELPIVRRQIGISYGEMVKVSKALEVAYSGVVRVANQDVLPYGATSPVAGDLAIDYALRTLNPVAAQTKLAWSNQGAITTNFTDAPSLYYNNRKVDIVASDIYQDEGNALWQASIDLAREYDYKNIPLGASISLVLGTETYSLLVESKNISREFGNSTYRIIGLSPASVYAAPAAQTITRVWDTPIQASAVAADVGMTVVWNTVDWTIPANRLSVTDATPMAIVKMVAAAAGAVLESAPDGTLSVRPRYPVAMNKLDTATVDQIYTDYDDNLSSTEQYKTARLYNRYLLSDVSTAASYRDMVDYVADPDTGLKGLLKVYLSPWRSNYRVRSTKFINFSFYVNGVKTETLTEVVEFRAGSGAVSKPIQSLDSVVWMDTPLGGTTFVVGDTSITASVSAESLAKVTYTAQYLEYRVTGADGDSAQFIVEAT